MGGLRPTRRKIFFTTILFAAVIAGIGAYLLKTPTASLLSPTAVQSTPTISLSPAAQANPTADWKTYTNDMFHFSFSYPASYYKYLFIDDQSPHSLSLHIGVKGDPEAKNGYLPVNSALLHVMVRDDVQTLNGLLGSEPYNYTGTEKEMTTIGGEKGYLINNLNVSTTLRNESGFGYSALVQHKQIIYIIGISSPLQDVLEAHRLEFNQILSTFKFTH